MEYIGLNAVSIVFGILGLVAFVEVTAIKGKILELERQLGRMKGTAYHDSKIALSQAARACMGERVIIGMKEDYQDADIIAYGNTSKGSVILTDADEDWLLIQISTPKGAKDKLIRLEAIQSLTKK